MAAAVTQAPTTTQLITAVKMGHASVSAAAQQQGEASGNLLSGPDHACSTAYNTVPEEHLYYSLCLIRKGV